MTRTIEVVIEIGGNVRLLESIDIAAARRGLVTVLDEALKQLPSETALLSHCALEKDWNRSEEDAVWAHLQSAH